MRKKISIAATCLALLVGVPTLMRTTNVDKGGEVFVASEAAPVVTQEPTAEEIEWARRVDASFEPCPSETTFDYPPEYYSGPLIDSHFHIPGIPDAEADVTREELLEEAEGPSLGVTVTMTEIACTLKNEGTERAFSFFPVYPEIPEQMVEVASRTMAAYGDLFVPFIMPPDHDDQPDGFATVSADVLVEMLAYDPGLFVGYGEIGLYDRGVDAADQLLPDDSRLLDIYSVVGRERLVVYFHPGEEQIPQFEEVLRRYPNITFLVHGDQIDGDILGLMERYPNIYYTIDALYGDEPLLNDETTKQEFLEHLEDADWLVYEDLEQYEDMINAQPDRFLWGTDRGNTVWTYDREVGQALVDYARRFIGRLDPSVQEKFAHANARRLLERAASVLR